jgi:transcription elongation factor Elf1
MILESVITCPHCGTAKLESMPTDACQFFYTCTGCGVMLRPLLPPAKDAFDHLAAPPRQALEAQLFCATENRAIPT